MTDGPAPLVPADVDLRDFGFMPLDVRRLLTSETWIEAADDPRLGHATMSLWAESWHQIPAGSLPDNDSVLYRFSMCPNREEWRRIKERALRGWVKCSDGLLYHPVVAAKALESWQHKLARRERTKAATEARERKRREQEAQRHEQRDVERDVQQHEQRHVHQGTGTGTGTGTGISVLTTPTRCRSLSGQKPDAAPPAVDKSPKNGHAVADDVLNRHEQSVKPYLADAEDVLSYLNKTAGKAYLFRNPKKALTASAKLVIDRLKEGYSRVDLREVVFERSAQWRGDAKMDAYLRPETLFSKKNFEQYLGHLRGNP